MNRVGRYLLIRSLVRARPIHSNSPLLHAKVPLSRPSTYIPSITAKRAFHASRPTQIPLIPFAGVIAGLAKSSSIVNIISFASKTSLTLLPYHLRKGKGASMLLALVMIPLAGSGLLVAIGLDMAPNTSRLRMIYMSKDEEEQLMAEAMKMMRDMWGSDRVDDDAPFTLWVKEIADRISKVTVDDARAPVREYKEDPKTDYQLHVIWDNETLNALCLGRNIVIYDPLMDLLDYDPDKIAVILSHELGHSLQRHTCEKFGMESLLYSLIDMARGFFWMFTEPLGPYINENLNTYLIKFVDAEVTTAFSRPLEVEADLIGLKLMAKAGFDPRAAIEVWEKMDEHTKKMEQDEEDDDDEEWTFGNFETRIQTYFDSMYKSWFGSTHPYCSQRAQYMREHMDEAVAIYEESITLNGKPNIAAFDWSVYEENDEEEEAMEPMIENESKGYLYWIKSIFSKNPAATTMTA